MVSWMSSWSRSARGGIFSDFWLPWPILKHAALSSFPLCTASEQVASSSCPKRQTLATKAQSSILALGSVMGNCSLKLHCSLGLIASCSSCMRMALRSGTNTGQIAASVLASSEKRQKRHVAAAADLQAVVLRSNQSLPELLCLSFCLFPTGRCLISHVPPFASPLSGCLCICIHVFMPPLGPDSCIKTAAVRLEHNVLACCVPVALLRRYIFIPALHVLVLQKGSCTFPWNEAQLLC